MSATGTTCSMPQPPANSTKPLVFNPTGRCPAYEVPQDIAGPALEKQRNDDYQLAQLIKENVPVAPVAMGTDGGMNRVFAAKLANDRAGLRQRRTPARAADPSRHAAADAERAARRPRGRHAEDGVIASRRFGLFGNLFDGKSSGQPSTGAAARKASRDQVASSDTSAQDHSGFFGNLFKPKTAAQPAAAAGQGAALAGLRPGPEHAKPRRQRASRQRRSRKSRRGKAEDQSATRQVAARRQPLRRPRTTAA